MAEIQELIIDDRATQGRLNKAVENYLALKEDVEKIRPTQPRELWSVSRTQKALMDSLKNARCRIWWEIPLGCEGGLIITDKYKIKQEYNGDEPQIIKCETPEAKVGVWGRSKKKGGKNKVAKFITNTFWLAMVTSGAFFTLKLLGFLTWNWGQVFIPLYIWGGLALLGVVLGASLVGIVIKTLGGSKDAKRIKAKGK